MKEPERAIATTVDASYTACTPLWLWVQPPHCHPLSCRELVRERCGRNRVRREDPRGIVGRKSLRRRHPALGRPRSKQALYGGCRSMSLARWPSRSSVANRRVTVRRGTRWLRVSPRARMRARSACRDVLAAARRYAWRKSETVTRQRRRGSEGPVVGGNVMKRIPLHCFVLGRPLTHK